ncbi:MAG TPA: ABC transporter permease [bacterium]|nr:ABC transporter permease [bacterium]
MDARSWRVFIRNKKSLTGLVIAFAFLCIGLFGPALSSTDPSVQDLSRRLEGPGPDHPLGMDHLGRDMLSRILHGARISVTVGLVVTLISLTAGVIIGMMAGYAGGWIDDAVMRCVDVMLAFPGILLAIAMVAVLGPDIKNVMIALCIMGWVGYARLARGQVLALRDSEYVQAARSLGAGSFRIVFRHLLPNIMAPVIVQATLGMAGVIIAEAGLSFLGLGVQPPTPSWGGILNSGVEYFRTGAHMTIFPGLAIMIVVMGLNFLGDGLRDALDPRT